VGFFLIPFQNSLFPGYLISKLVISNGGVALQMLPLLADYVHVSTRGTAAGFNYTLAFAGGIISALVIAVCSLIDLPLDADYFILSVSICVFGLFIGRGVKPGNTYYKKDLTNSSSTSTEESFNDISLKEQGRRVCKSFRDIPWLFISMICAILGNSDFYVLTTGLVFFVQAHVADQNEASFQVGLNQGIFCTMSVLVSVVYGKLMDKTPHLKLLMPFLFVAMIGFFIVQFITDVTGPLFYGFMALEGASLPGVFIFATFLGVKYAPSDQRGTIGGIITGVGFLAAMIVLIIGGYMYDQGIDNASFLIFFVMIIISFLLIVVVYFTKIKGKHV